MSSRAMELKVMRRTVGAFIRAEEIDIIFTRPTKVQGTSGGWTEGAPQVLDAQKFRVVPFKRRLVHQESDTQDGAIPLVPYVLVGRPGVDVQRDDEFTWNGKDCKVVGVEAMTLDDSDRVSVEFEAR